MRDQYNRRINYLRISVTDRCNLKCNYCVPEDGVYFLSSEEILSYEEIREICKIAAQNGITDVRITGGEPLTRPDLYKLIEMLSSISGIQNIGLTTNGVLLAENLDKLASSGLSSVNISLDTLDAQKYVQITGRDYLNQVLDGIKVAIESGIKVKINSVLKDMSEIDYLIALAKDNVVDVRFIELMPIGIGKAGIGVSNVNVLNHIKSNYAGVKLDDTKHGSGPSVYYKLKGFKGSIGLISPIHGKFCDSCNRIRLSSTGKIKSCLCYATNYDLKDALREGNTQLLEELIKKAIYNKPHSHCFENENAITESANMVSIGG